MTSVDVIIPVYRPDEKLNRLLAALQTQTVKPERIILVHTGEILEGEPDYGTDVVIVCDETESADIKRTTGSIAESAAKSSTESVNGSNTEPMAETKKILCMIPGDQFDHGGTRNLGASFSQSEVMVFMTQDAVPADDRLLEVLVQSVTGNAERFGGIDCSGGAEITVAVVYARQLPYGDCRAIERYIREFNYPGKSELRTEKDIPFRGIKTFCNSNVCSAYRRDVFDQLGGFVEKTIFNEDMLFGAKAIHSGYGMVYAAEAKVYHSHNLGLSDQFHRNFDNAVSQAEHPEVFAAVSSEKEGMKLVKYCFSRMREDGRLYLAPYFVLNCACRYAGFFLGKRYQKLPKRLVKACSLNKRYWKR